MTKTFYLYFLLVIFGQNVLLAQNYLVLERSGSKKDTNFKIGETMRFKLNSEKFYRKDQIVNLEDSTIEFKGYKVYLNEIEKIDISKKRFSGFNFNEIGKLIQIAGAGYVVLDQFNKYVVQGQQWEFEQDVWITGGILFGTGTILRLLHPKRFTISPHNKIYIFEMSNQ